MYVCNVCMYVQYGASEPSQMHLSCPSSHLHTHTYYIYTRRYLDPLLTSRLSSLSLSHTSCIYTQRYLDPLLAYTHLLSCFVSYIHTHILYTYTHMVRPFADPFCLPVLLYTHTHTYSNIHADILRPSAHLSLSPLVSYTHTHVPCTRRHKLRQFTDSSISLALCLFCLFLCLLFQTQQETLHYTKEAAKEVCALLKGWVTKVAAA